MGEQWHNHNCDHDDDYNEYNHYDDCDDDTYDDDLEPKSSPLFSLKGGESRGIIIIVTMMMIAMRTTIMMIVMMTPMTMI